MKNKLHYLFIILLFASLHTQAQSFYRNVTRTIASGADIYDSVTVSGLSSTTLTGTFGLDSVTLNNITYNGWDQDLVISLIAPDGTIIRLSENEGGGGNNFTGTCFTMSVNNFINDASAPFTGQMQPEWWLGMVNNGQNGNGKWKLHILNTSTGSGTLHKWGIHFGANPAPPSFFDSSTLPIVVVNTNDEVIPFYSDTKIYGTMGVIYHGAGVINHVTDSFNNYNGYLSIKVRGSSTRYFPTKSYTIETEDASHNNFNVPLVDMPSDNDWVLYAPWDDKSLIRDVITYGISNEMGEYASRTRMCELILDGDYRGVYVLEEKIKQGANRVNIHKLDPGDTTGSAVTGGYIFEVDRQGTPQYDSWASPYPPCSGSPDSVYFAYEVPKSEDINTPQKDYIASYVDSFETALMDTSLYNTVHGYRHYSNVPSLIDFSILQEMGHNVDGYRLSSYLHKDRNNVLYGGPIWDFNEGYGNSDYYNGWAYNTFEWDLPCPMNDGNLNPFWWQKLLTDTSYVSEFKCRYTQLSTNVLDTNSLDHMVDSLTTILQVPEVRHYERWPILGVYTWPNYYVGNTYNDEVTYLKSWLHSRVAWLDSQWIIPSCIDTANTTQVANIKTETLSIYPDPTANVINIASNNIVQKVLIYNMVGQLMYENSPMAQTCSIPLRQYGFVSGIYNVLIYTQNGITRRKIVVSD